MHSPLDIRRKHYRVKGKGRGHNAKVASDGVACLPAGSRSWRSARGMGATYEQPWVFKRKWCCPQPRGASAIMCVDEPSAVNRDPMARNDQKSHLFNSHSVLSHSQVASVRWIAIEICDELDVVIPFTAA